MLDATGLRSVTNHRNIADFDFVLTGGRINTLDADMSTSCASKTIHLEGRGLKSIRLWGGNMTSENNAALMMTRLSAASYAHVEVSVHSTHSWCENVDISRVAPAVREHVARPVACVAVLLVMMGVGLVIVGEGSAASVSWSTSIDDLWMAEVHEGVVFATTHDGDVMSVDPDDGRMLWRTHLSDDRFLAIGPWSGRSLIVRSLDQLFALRTEDGRLLWESEEVDEVAQVVADEEYVYAVVGGPGGAELRALKALDGAEVWHTWADYPFGTELALGRVVVIAGKDETRALERGTGRELWNVSGEGKVAVQGDRVVATIYPEVRGLDATTGATVWKDVREYAQDRVFSIGPAGVAMTFYNRTKAAAYFNGTHVDPPLCVAGVYDPTAGLVASIPLDEVPGCAATGPGSPFIPTDDGRYVYTNGAGSVALLDVARGEVVWTRQSVIPPAAVDDLNVYITDDHGRVSAHAIDSGEARWSLLVGDRVHSLHLVNGTLVVVHADGLLGVDVSKSPAYPQVAIESVSIFPSTVQPDRPLAVSALLRSDADHLAGLHVSIRVGSLEHDAVDVAIPAHGTLRVRFLPIPGLAEGRHRIVVTAGAVSNESEVLVSSTVQSKDEEPTSFVVRPERELRLEGQIPRLSGKYLVMRDSTGTNVVDVATGSVVSRVAGDARLRADRLLSGECMYRFPAGGEVWCNPTFSLTTQTGWAGSQVIVWDSSNAMALDPDTGAIRWRISQSGRHVGGNDDFVLFEDFGRFHAYDAASGRPRWNLSTGWGTKAVVESDQWVLFVNNTDARSVDPKTGASFWEEKAEYARVHGTYVESRTEDGTILRTAEGAVVWQGPAAVSAVAKDRVALEENGSIVVRDLGDGRELFRLPGLIYEVFLTDEGAFAVVRHQEDERSFTLLEAFSSSGAPRWKVPVDDYVTFVGVVDRALIIRDGGNRVRILPIDAPSEIQLSSPTIREKSDSPYGVEIVSRVQNSGPLDVAVEVKFEGHTFLYPSTVWVTVPAGGMAEAATTWNGGPPGPLPIRVRAEGADDAEALLENPKSPFREEPTLGWISAVVVLVVLASIRRRSPGC